MIVDKKEKMMDGEGEAHNQRQQDKRVDKKREKEDAGCGWTTLIGFQVIVCVRNILIQDAII